MLDDTRSPGRRLRRARAVGALGKVARRDDRRVRVPNNGQNASTQSKDEGECYNWAVMNTGSDPFDLQKTQSQQAQQTQSQVAQAQSSAKGAGGAGSWAVPRQAP